MNSFDIDDVEKSIMLLNSSNSEDALRFLFEFSQHPNNLDLSFDLFKKTTNSAVKLQASIILMNAVIEKWNSADQRLQNEIITHFSDLIQAKSGFGAVLQTNCTRIMAILALYDHQDRFKNFINDALDFIQAADKNGDLENFLKFSQLIAIYLNEIENCNFLTSVSQMLVENNAYLSKNLLIALVNQLISIWDTDITQRISSIFMNSAGIGISILSNLLEWGFVGEILSNDILNSLLSVCLVNESTHYLTIDCLDIAFFDRSDIALSFSRISSLIVSSFANLPSFTDQAISFITKFLRKFFYLLELQCFPQEDIAKLKLVLSMTFHVGVNENSANFETDYLNQNQDELVNGSMLNGVRKLLELTLIHPPSEDTVENFWILWEIIAHKAFSYSNGQIREEKCVNIILPLIPLILAKTSEYISSCIDCGSVTSPHMPLFFKYFIKSFQKEYTKFIFQESLSPSIIYAAAFLKLHDDKMKFLINKLSEQIIASNSPSEFYEPILFFFSKLCVTLQPEIFSKFVELCCVCLSSSESKLQCSAAHALYESFNIAPLRFELNPFISNFPDIASPLCDDALIKFLKLIAYMTKVYQLDFFALSNYSLFLLHSRTEVALKAIEQMAYSSGKKCSLFFSILWEPLFSIIEENNDLNGLIFKAFLAAAKNIQLNEIEDQIQRIILIGYSIPDEIDNLFYFFADILQNRDEYNTFYPQLEQLIKKSEPSVSMFLLIQEFSIGQLDIEMIISKVAQGAQQYIPDISKAAFECARSLLYSFFASNQIFNFLGIYRRLLLQISITCLMDMMHKSGFSKQATLINDIFIFGEKTNDNSYLVEFVEEMKRMSEEIVSGFYTQLANHLNQVKLNIVAFKEVLSESLILMRKATPFQMRTFFDEDTKFEEKQMQQEDQMLMSTNLDGLPMEQLEALTLFT